MELTTIIITVSVITVLLLVNLIRQKNGAWETDKKETVTIIRKDFCPG